MVIQAVKKKNVKSENNVFLEKSELKLDRFCNYLARSASSIVETIVILFSIIKENYV
jgi:hypothetical protein